MHWLMSWVSHLARLGAAILLYQVSQLVMKVGQDLKVSVQSGCSATDLKGTRCVSRFINSDGSGDPIRPRMVKPS